MLNHAMPLRTAASSLTMLHRVAFKMPWPHFYSTLALRQVVDTSQT